jgi:hypothetical protein
MAMTVQIVQGTGGSPTWAQVTAIKWNRTDDAATASAIPTPTATGTNFSFVKSMMVNITAVGGLSMTNILVGKVANEATTGTKLWHRTDHAEGSYVQATAAPAPTGDNNSTAPVIPAGGNNTSVIALPLIGSASVYSAGPHNTTGRKGNMVEMCLGVDSGNTTAGSAVSTPTLRWSWTEA